MSKTLLAMYSDDMIILEGAKKLVSEGVHIKEVFSPFPIHGIDPVIGVRPTRLAICAFIYGCIGLSLALTGMYYFLIVDWPMNIGGKPNKTFLQNLPSFIPIAFEFTVLCTAHGMCITYFLRNKILPGMTADNPDPRTTDDKFVMEIDLADTSRSEDEVISMLNETGAIEINAKV